MRRLTIGSFLVAIVGALALLGLVLSSGDGARSGYAAFNVVDPIPNQIQNIAVDTDITGNTPKLVTSVDNCRAITSGSFQIDIVVDEIDIADGIGGQSFSLNYNPAILEITARGPGSAMLFFQGPNNGTYNDTFSDALPDTDGDYRHEALDLGGGITPEANETGEGVVARLTVNIIGSGISVLDLTDNVEFDGTPNTLTTASVPISPNNVLDGEIHTDGSACPVFVDLAVVNVVTTAPAGATGGVPFNVSVDTDVTNSGPPAVLADLAVTLNMPADCSAAGGPTQTANSSYAVGLNLRNNVFVVTCTNPSFHAFTATSTVTETDTGANETALGNNTGTSAASTTAVTSTSDFGLGTATTSTSLPTNCLPASPPAPGCTPLPRLVVGANGTVTVNKDITCTSGCPVQVTDTITFVGSTWNGDGGPNNPAQCTAVTSPQSVSQSTSAADPSFSFTISCPAAVGASAERAGLCFDGIDNDGDTVVDDGCSSFISDPLDIPLSPQIAPIVFSFSNSLAASDVHVLDSTPADNSQIISIPVWVTKPFTPFFQVTIDEGANPSAIDLPIDDNCLTTGAAFPAGTPCEMAFVSRIPNNPAVPDDAQPLALALGSIPRPAFSIAYGRSGPAVGALGEPAQPGIPNGDTVGNFGFLVNIDVGGGCNADVNIPYGAVNLVDAALPASSAGFDDDGDTFVDEDPPGGGNQDPGNDAETDEDGNGPNLIVPEGPNSNTSVTNTAGAGMSDPTIYPTRLNADDTLKAITAGGGVLWARYTGHAPGVNTSVNILVFNVGTAYLQHTIVGDPAAPPNPLATYQCTRFDSTTDYLGITAAGGQLRQCNVTGTHIVGANYTRADTFEAHPAGDAVACSPADTAVDLTKDEIIGDNNPVGDIVDAGIPAIRTVTNTIQGTGDLTLSLTGPAICNPHFVNPLDSFPTVIGGTQTSVVTIPNASGVVTADYSVTCPVGGPYNVQVVANLEPSGAENTANNQDENVVQVIVTCDSDGDGVCTPTDNCPNVANPDQTDTDGDGLGDACDPDDDDDGIPDTTDDCDLLAEDVDGIDDSDGCPDTDVGVTVEKEEDYDVDVSVSTAKSVEITVTNGNYPANVRVVITAVSQVGECEVRLVAQPGDLYSEYFTDEVAGPPAPDTLTSQIEKIIPMAAGQSVVMTYTYNIHCFQESAHTNAFELQVDALPLAPVQEEDLGDDPLTPPDSASNNVHKNFPDVTAWNNADLQKLGIVVAAPATSAANTNFSVTATSTIKNNGPASADYSDSTTLVLPGDCSIVVGANPQVTSGTLASGAQTNNAAVWTVTCTNPSNHTFTANNTLSLTGPTHTKDPNAGNNTGSGSDTMTITAVSDSSVAVVVNAPAAANAGATFQVSVDATVALNFATSAALTIGLSGPGDCTLTATGGQSVPAAVNGVYTATWDVSCSSGSNHSFSGNASITPVHPQHVSETNTANNTANGSDSTVVTKLGDPSCTTVVAPDGTVSTTGPVGTNVVVTNNCNAGGLSPTTITETTGGTCTISGGPGNYNVQIPAGTNCTYSVQVCIAATNIHESDTNTGNNCASDTGLICLDTDGDGVDNGGAPCDGPDNCPNDVNPGQEDSDLDGFGDACDDTPEHDVLVKYIILVGPAAINLSDTNGRYMWVIAEVGNHSDHTELVTINMSIAEAVPAGCTRVIVMILPGQTTFVMPAGEQKFIVWRVRYECHTPATGQVINQTVTVSIAHGDIDGAGPHNGSDSVPANNTKTTTKQVIIQ